MNIKSLEECKILMIQIADFLQHNDKHVKHLSIRERTFLNDVGKIIGWIWTEMIAYNHAESEKKLEIRQKIHKIRYNLEMNE